MLIKKYLLIKIKVFCVIILFVAINVISSTGQTPIENAINDNKNPSKTGDDYGCTMMTNVNGLYFLRGYDQYNKNDVGSLLRASPEENESTQCGMFINFHFAEGGIYSGTTEISNIYYHFWQQNLGLGWFNLGYSTSSNNTADFNESIPIDTNDYICEVNNFRLIQATQTTNEEIAVFEGQEIYNFTIKYLGDNPHIICNPNQYSFIILNLEDNMTLQYYDRDNDYLTDFAELYIYYTNPFDMDTDKDGASDYDEVMGELFGYENSNPNDPYDTTEFRQLYAKAEGPYTALINEEIQFYGEASGGSPPYTWHWNFGDNSFSNEKNPKHTFNKANNYTITLNVTDQDGISIIDNTTVIINNLYANFIKPENALYLLNKNIGPLSMPMIFGPINIEIDTTSTISKVNKVEFYINKALKSTDNTTPYIWRWRERVFFKHTIKIIIFDDLGNSKDYELMVWKFF
jgi:PKD repeat protein